MRFSALGCALGASLVFLAACDRPNANLREWAAADHDPPASGQAPQVSALPARAASAPDTADTSLVDLAWQRNCSRCHGQRGRGDGPEGAMVKSPDLTRADWQAKVTDQEIAEIIRKGRNKMPAFDLPPQVLEGLVSRIRSLRASPQRD